jgi:HTH-type transcriptional regulator / antitoxin HigA
MKRSDMQIDPIRNEDDHAAAVARIAALMGAEPDTQVGEEFDILATLVDAYEAEHHVIDAPDSIAAIEFRMEQQGLTRKDLEPIIGSRARVSEVMTRKRSFTVAMIRRVRSELGISADLLISISKSRAVANSRRGKTKVSSKPSGMKKRGIA